MRNTNQSESIKIPRWRAYTWGAHLPLPFAGAGIAAFGDCGRGLRQRTLEPRCASAGGSLHPLPESGTAGLSGAAVIRSDHCAVSAAELRQSCGRVGSAGNSSALPVAGRSAHRFDHGCGSVTRFSWTTEEPHHERKQHPYHQLLRMLQGHSP